MLITTKILSLVPQRFLRVHWLMDGGGTQEVSVGGVKHVGDGNAGRDHENAYRRTDRRVDRTARSRMLDVLRGPDAGRLRLRPHAALGRALAGNQCAESHGFAARVVGPWRRLRLPVGFAGVSGVFGAAGRRPIVAVRRSFA